MSKARTYFSGFWLVALAGAAFLASFLPLADPLGVNLEVTLQAPSWQHWLGTDELGRDIFSRVIFAARSTLIITLGATAISLGLGILLGAAAGYFGGWLDKVVSFLIDLFWVVPFVVFVVLIVAVMGVSIPTLMVTIGAINWVTAARVVRAKVIEAKEQDYIRAANAYGFSGGEIMLWHLMPNLRHSLIVLLGYGAVEVLTLETGLAFIGLSLPAPSPTWGGLLAEGLGYFSSAWWMVLSAALVITLTLASLQGLAREWENH